MIDNLQDNCLMEHRIKTMKRRTVLERLMPTYRKITTNNCISLTFDDGPDKKYTPRVLDVLRKHKTKACFFLVGKKAERYPDIVGRILEEGHDIGNHTYSHPVSPIFKRQVVKDEIRLTGDIIKKITGHRPRLFRPPWLSWNMNAVEMRDIAENLGYFSIKWSISSLDWLGIRRVIKHNIFDKDINHGDILLFHDGAEKFPLTRRQATVDLLPEIICSIRNKRLLPVKLSELLRTQDIPLAYF